MKAIAMCGLLLAVFFSAAQASDPYADTVVSYTTGSGGVNTAYNNSSAALGGVTSYATVVYPAWKATDIVGIGLGGELTLGFNEPIVNDANNPYGLDFTVFGNEMFILSSGTYQTLYGHSGLTVWVSLDNILYYQLATTLGADDQFPTQATGDPTVPLDPSITTTNFVGLTSKTGGPDLYKGSAGGASYDISRAVDSEGKAVTLASISYVKIVGTSGYGYVDAIVAVKAVPEPSTYALLVAGGGMAWWSIQRKRTSASA